MCLITKQRYWRWATKNIECYKVVVKDWDSLGVREIIKSPYQGTEIPEDVVSGKLCFYAEGPLRDSFYAGYRNVFGGVIHAYVNERLAKHYITKDNRFLYKCIIPMGTRYIVGEGGEICAKKIRFIEQIKY